MKQEIYQSRVVSARRLAEAIGKLESKPRAFISASATGYYGDRGEAELTEDSPPGADFLARVCVDWEGAARAVERFGVRAVQVRTAPVVGRGGFLQKLLWAYRIGLGGPLGSGRQWMPWVHLKDIVDIYCFALEHEELRGPVNACAPGLVRNREWARTLGRVLRRPTVVRVPPWAVRIAYGELAEFVTASQKVVPQRLRSAGYTFSHPALEGALRDVFRAR